MKQVRLNFLSQPPCNEICMRGRIDSDQTPQRSFENGRFTKVV